MCAGVLVAGRIGLDHVPAEQRKHLVEAGVTGQVGVVEVGVAAVAEADVGRHQRQARLVAVADPVAVRIEERAGVDIRLPLAGGNVAHGDRSRGRGAGWVTQPDRRRKPVHQHIVPLVEDRHSPLSVRNSRESELPFVVTLGEGEVFPIRIAQADVALGECETVV
ncbi:MAG TPA: hypothetical protein VLL82_06865, partial [Mycobacterium sp.]|nr:hypothetical protein [Mycobacterium sp.]